MLELGIIAVSVPWITTRLRDLRWVKKKAFKLVLLSHLKMVIFWLKVSLHMSQGTHQDEAYAGFCNMKRLGIFLFPMDGMLVHCRVIFRIKFAGTHLYRSRGKQQNCKLVNKKKLTNQEQIWYHTFFTLCAWQRLGLGFFFRSSDWFTGLVKSFSGYFCSCFSNRCKTYCLKGLIAGDACRGTARSVIFLEANRYKTQDDLLHDTNV